MSNEKKDKDEFVLNNSCCIVNMDDCIAPNWDVDCDCNLISDITGENDFYEDRGTINN